jgi:hypothetical protein
VFVDAHISTHSKKIRTQFNCTIDLRQVYCNSIILYVIHCIVIIKSIAFCRKKFEFENSTEEGIRLKERRQKVSCLLGIELTGRELSSSLMCG